jgi:hypothetical protein
MTSPPRPRRSCRHTTAALFGRDVATLVDDALAAGLDRADRAERLRAAADRLEGDDRTEGAK